ncbi:M50 family metallopeptidase [Pseudomonas sp. LB3P58]|jgi:hypothetical protein
MIGNKLVIGVLRLLSAVQMLISMCGVLAATTLLAIGIDSDLAPFLALLMASVLTILSICVHEGGHYLGAKWSHMTVLAMRIAAVELLPLRRGWRMRWSPRLKRLNVGGYVMAASDPYRSMRRQTIMFTAMGPVLNLFVGVLCIAAGLLSQESIRMFALAFGASNIAMGISNLIPTYLGGISDGAGLIAWCFLKDERTPLLANARLLSLSVAGVPSEELPAGDIAQLSSEPMPAPLLAVWYRLNALQSRGDWHGAVQEGETLHALLETPSQSPDSMALLIAILQVELGFSRAMLRREAGEMRDDLLSDEVDWCCPVLRPRCLALHEILKGNHSAAEQYLDRSLSIARNARDLSLGKSELKLAAYVRELGGGTVEP